MGKVMRNVRAHVQDPGLQRLNFMAQTVVPVFYVGQG